VTLGFDDEGSAAGVIEILTRRFPLAFSLAEKERKPLKVGIFRDLKGFFGDSVTDDALVAALKSYCNSLGYLKRCRAGKARLALDGKPTGAVSADEARFARLRRDWLEDAKRRRR
jgi:sRNA-binding protein